MSSVDCYRALFLAIADYFWLVILFLVSLQRVRSLKSLRSLEILSFWAIVKNNKGFSHYNSYYFVYLQNRGLMCHYIPKPMMQSRSL